MSGNCCRSTRARAQDGRTGGAKPAPHTAEGEHHGGLYHWSTSVGTSGDVSDCVETYQSGQDENVAFFWHQICCGSRRGDSQPLAIARDTKKTDQKAKFLSECPRRKSPIFPLPVLMQFQVTADRRRLG